MFLSSLSDDVTRRVNLRGFSLRMKSRVKLVSWGCPSGKDPQYRFLCNTLWFSWLYLNPPGISLVNKPLQAAGMPADNVRRWEIDRKMNIWPRSEASRANMKFWEQSFSQGHYQATYQQAKKGLIYFITLPLIFISQLNRLTILYFPEQHLRTAS